MSASQALRIFIVDDDVVVLNTLSQGLTELGHEVATFTDGASAEEAWGHQAPDVAVIDINLPDTNGADLTRRVLKISHRPIITLSQHHDSEVVATAIASGVSTYMVKPVTAVQLLPPIQTAIARSADMRERVFNALAEAPDAAIHNIHLDALLEQFGFGVAIIRGDKSLIRRNSAVDRMLEQGDILSLDGLRLSASDPAEFEKFEEFLEAILPKLDTDYHAQVVALGRGSPGRHVQIWGAPLLKPGEELQPGEMPWAVLLCADPDEEIPLPAHLLKSLYSLTATESRLAEALVNGLSVEQFAQKSKTSYNTARSHLKSVFVKTRTNRQVDLVRLLSTLLSSLNS